MVQKPQDGRQARAQKTRISLLEAAESVIRDEGVSALTLARVAEAAGVSKGGLLYHFSSKSELIGALLEHTLDRTDADLNDLTNGDDPGAFARAYLDYVSEGGDPRRGTATGIFASAALDEGELAPAQEQFRQWQDRLLNDDGVDQAVAMLARIVGDGLWLIDLFDLASPTTEQRAEVLKLVDGLLPERVDLG